MQRFPSRMRSGSSVRGTRLSHHAYARCQMQSAKHSTMQLPSDIRNPSLTAAEQTTRAVTIDFADYSKTQTQLVIPPTPSSCPKSDSSGNGSKRAERCSNEMGEVQKIVLLYYTSNVKSALRMANESEGRSHKLAVVNGSKIFRPLPHPYLSMIITQQHQHQHQHQHHQRPSASEPNAHLQAHPWAPRCSDETRQPVIAYYQIADWHD
jgi:hypothetical protein